jgi:hypothetical protein
MYTLKLGNKTMSYSHNNKFYIIGFKNSLQARKVQYSIHPDFNFTLLRDDSKNQDKLTYDDNATLFIPKCAGSVLLPENDPGLHLHFCDNFLELPVKKQLGIIIPHTLLDEDHHEFVYKSLIFESIVI